MNHTNTSFETKITYYYSVNGYWIKNNSGLSYFRKKVEFSSGEYFFSLAESYVTDYHYHGYNFLGHYIAYYWKSNKLL